MSNIEDLPDEDLIVPDIEGIPEDEGAEPEDANADHDGPDDYEVKP